MTSCEATAVQSPRTKQDKVHKRLLPLQALAAPQGCAAGRRKRDTLFHTGAGTTAYPHGKEIRSPPHTPYETSISYYDHLAVKGKVLPTSASKKEAVVIIPG